MYSKIFPLCQLEHSYQEANLKLSSTCSLKLCYPEGLPFSISNLDTLQSIADAGVWAGSGNVLQFLLHLKDGTSRGAREAVLIEKMGVVIRDFEFWEVLGLRAALEVSHSHGTIDDSPHHVSLTLTSKDQHSTTMDTALNIVATRGLNPPNGVPIVRLDAINVELSLATLCNADASCTRAMASSGSTKDYALERRVRMAAESAGQLQLLEKATDKPELTRNDSDLRKICQSVVQWDTLADGECNSMWDMAESSQDTVTWPHSSQQTLWSIASSSSDAFEVRNAINLDKVLGGSSTLEGFSKLVDTALRTTIGGAATLKTRGIVLSSDSGGPKLAEIAPAVFSPGYATAISKRDVLLSNITRSLSAFCDPSHSIKLKWRADEMTQLSLDERLLFSRNDTDFNSQSQMDLGAIIKLRLWNLAQRRLFESQATRQLKPSKCSNSQSLLEAGSDCMLEEADSSDFQFETSFSVDERFNGIERAQPDTPIANSWLSSHGEEFLLDHQDDFYDMLELNEILELDEDMLDCTLLGQDLGFKATEEFAGEDEILQDDDDGYKDVLMGSFHEMPIEDEDEDLFQD